MALKIQLRRGTAAEWTSANPVLMQGEMGVETDTLKVKLGDGSAVWSALPYFTQGAKGDQGEQGIQGIQGVQGNTGPVGPIGPANTLSVGTVTTGDAGSDAVVTITGDAPNQTISFSIPQGIQGIQGIQGEKGDGLPSGGTAGQVVVKTVDGTAWTDLPPSTLADQEDVNITSPQNKQVLKYDGTEWVNATASGGVTVSDTNPVDPSQGDGWFYAEDGTQFIRYDDGNSVQWVQPNAVLSSQIEQRYFSPNYVINGGFDIWQRGTSLAQSGGGVGADMWRQYTDSGSGTQSRDTNNVIDGLPRQSYRFSAGANNTNWSLFQVVESSHCAPLIGQTVTFSVYLMSSVARTFRLSIGVNSSPDAGWSASGWSTTSFFDANVGNSWARYSFTATIPATARTVQFGISSNGANMTSGSAVNVAGVQVELGSTASGFRRNANSIQGELAACQRYYYRISGGFAHYLGIVRANSTTSATCVITFKQPMRAVPSSFESASLEMDNPGIGTISVTGSYGNFVTGTDTAAISITGSGLTNTATYFLRFATTGHIAWSAEL